MKRFDGLGEEIIKGRRRGYGENFYDFRDVSCFLLVVCFFRSYG